MPKITCINKILSGRQEIKFQTEMEMSSSQRSLRLPNKITNPIHRNSIKKDNLLLNNTTFKKETTKSSLQNNHNLIRIFT
jgi:hypothetical protein